MRRNSMESLRNLPFGWDGEHGCPPSDTALRLAERILATLAQPCWPFPLPDGGVQLEWHGDLDIELEVDATGACQLLVTCGDEVLISLE